MASRDQLGALGRSVPASTVESMRASGRLLDVVIVNSRTGRQAGGPGRPCPGRTGRSYPAAGLNERIVSTVSTPGRVGRAGSTKSTSATPWPRIAASGTYIREVITPPDDLAGNAVGQTCLEPWRAEQWFCRAGFKIPAVG